MIVGGFWCRGRCVAAGVCVYGFTVWRDKDREGGHHHAEGQ
jgi:hypothetical protein